MIARRMQEERIASSGEVQPSFINPLPQAGRRLCQRHQNERPTQLAQPGSETCKYRAQQQAQGPQQERKSRLTREGQPARHARVDLQQIRYAAGVTKLDVEQVIEPKAGREPARDFHELRVVFEYLFPLSLATHDAAD